MIMGMIKAAIGTGALIGGAGAALAAAGDTAPIGAAANGPRLHAALQLRQRGPMPLADGDALVSAGGGTIMLAPFGDGFHVSARDRPDRGGPRNGGSLKAGAMRGLSWSDDRLETIGGRSLVRKITPALMLGYGERPARGLAFALEAGVLLRNRMLVSPLAGLSRSAFGSGLDQAGGGRGASLVQARIGYRF